MYLYGIKNHDKLPMRQHNYNKQHTVDSLILEYEAMSQKGTVVFFEETVFSQIISYYENESSIDQALAVVNQALNQYLDSTNLYCKKAELLAKQKQQVAAMNAIQQAEVLSPSDYEVKLIKAEVLGLFGDHGYALSIIQELKNACHIEHENQLADIFFSEGIIFEHMQQYDSVFNSWKQTLMFNPSHKEAMNRIWLSVEMSRKFDESIILCNKLIDHAPYSEKAWYNLGHAHTYYGNYEAAIEAYEYAFIIDKEFESAYRHCAELCMEIQDYAKALDCYEEVLTYILPDGELLFKIGQCYQFLGKIDIAQEFYKRSIKMDEINDEVYFHLGQCAAQEKIWSQAVIYLKKALEIERGREEYFIALAEVYATLSRKEKAYYYFNKAMELVPEQANYWIKYAAFLIKEEAYNDALELLEEAKENAVGTEFLFCEAACLFRMNQQKSAINVLAEALTEEFDMYPMLFDFAPELSNHKKIETIIDFYRYEA